jgi:hypothetical protein
VRGNDSRVISPIADSNSLSPNISSDELQRKEVSDIAKKIHENFSKPSSISIAPDHPTITDVGKVESVLHTAPHPKQPTAGEIDLRNPKKQGVTEDTIYIDQEGNFHSRQTNQIGQTKNI